MLGDESSWCLDPSCGIRQVEPEKEDSSIVMAALMRSCHRQESAADVRTPPDQKYFTNTD